MRARRWRLTRSQRAWLCAIAWTIAIAVCIASALATPVAPAVHV